MAVLISKILKSPVYGSSKNNFMAEQLEACSLPEKVKVQNALYPVSIFPKTVNSYTSQPVRILAER